jgi:hypothetical protein
LFRGLGIRELKENSDVALEVTGRGEIT